MPAAAPMIVARQLTKRYDRHVVVDGIAFEVARGRCFGLLGPNGAGKTTTLRMILGVTHPDGGELRIFDEPVPAAGRRVRLRMGVVPQIDNLDPDFTVEENLRVYGSYFGLPTTRLDARIPALLAFVELGERRASKVDALSGGMKRRLTIARALINDPELVVLDEPTTGLDPQVRHMIWARLGELVQQGKTLLLTTHYMEEAERLCDELVVMDHGRILDRGSPRDLVRRHCPAEVLEIRRPSSAVESLLGDAGDDCQVERVGETLYCRAASVRALVQRLEALPDAVFLHRPANLEDVFLHLTGRDLRK